MFDGDVSLFAGPILCSSTRHLRASPERPLQLCSPCAPAGGDACAGQEAGNGAREFGPLSIGSGRCGTSPCPFRDRAAPCPPRCCLARFPGADPAPCRLPAPLRPSSPGDGRCGDSGFGRAGTGGSGPSGGGQSVPGAGGAWQNGAARGRPEPRNGPGRLREAPGLLPVPPLHPAYGSAELGDGKRAVPAPPQGTPITGYHHPRVPPSQRSTIAGYPHHRPSHQDSHRFTVLAWCGSNSQYSQLSRQELAPSFIPSRSSALELDLNPKKTNQLPRAAPGFSP